MLRHIIISMAILLNVGYFALAQEEDSQITWPREVETENKAIITLYQPQLESFENNKLIGRMAISVKAVDQGLVFGAIWFSATLITDLEKRIAVLDELDITQTHFPDIEEDKVVHFARMLEAEIEGWDVEMSLDRLLASLEVAEVYQEQSANLNNAPPVIYFRTSPATLVYIDGDPILKESEESGIEYVANTPYFLVKDTKKGDFYLKGAKWWYTSKDAVKGWEHTTKVPNKIKKLADKVIDDEGMEEDSVLMAMVEAPELIITTVPAELIATDGEPKYTPIDGTTLLYVDNSENDILMDINSQNHYVLLAGRWYTSNTLEDGDWKFAEPGDLPKEFAEIPGESPMANVRTSVPGTEEANIAVLEQTIPQTATVDRKTATVEVQWDGDPKFEKIEGTSMSYGLNCDMSILLVDGKYYCVDNGIWFEAMKATGPWAVSTVRPEGVEDIPAENPVYNVKYVYIYDSTPEVVYVGYTPGYTCSYVYGGVVVYGTGYYYYPWYGHYYYPRPVTYGYGVHYNPYTGWGFSVGISFGRHYHRGLWGPRGYHRGYRHGYNRGYSRGYNRGYSRGYSQGAKRGYAAGSRNSNSNVYNNRNNGVKSTGVNQRQTAQNNAARNQSGNVGKQTQGQNRSNTPNTQQNTRASSKQNNVYSDKNGNVQRQNQNGSWENRSNSSGQWQQSGNKSQSTQQNSRDAQARQQGTQRQSNYNSSRTQTQSRSQPSGSRSSGGSRGGGGGRRR
jgi:hypothetical protein